MTNLGVGLGMMAGVGGTVGGAVGGIMQNTMGALGQSQQPQAAPTAPTEAGDFESRLAKLELLKGKIPDELYNKKMQEILDSI
jgi:hypothetical protein